MENTARAAALEALLQVDENQGYSNIVIDKVLNKYELEKRDSALASIIFYGVIEKRITLDYYIAKFLRFKNQTLSAATRDILRMAVYQMAFLEKIPESAAVNEAVNLAKIYKAPYGFINAVLREMIRNKELLSLPDENSENYLSVKYSLPQQLIDMWVSSYGESCALKLLEAFSEKSRTYVRVNNTKTNVQAFIAGFNEEIAVEEYFGIDNACKIVSGGNIAKLPQFEQGLFHVQDLSSQFLCEMLDPQPGENIIDVCAAPGGKTFTISERMNGTGKVYSYDIYKGRVKLIRGGAYRLGLTNILASQRDALSEKCEIENADRILCDVPCSGFGTIRRKPEIRYKSVSEANELPEIQYNILCKSSKFLKPGGLLMYSTCTLNPNENGGVVDRFIKNNANFEAVRIKMPQRLKRTIDEPDNQLTMMPFAGDTDGFFVSIFRKKSI